MPFTGQMDYYERCGKLHARVRSLREYTTGKGLGEAERMHATALASRPEDLHQRLTLAGFDPEKYLTVESNTNQFLEQGMILGDLFEFVGAQPIAARIADVCQ